MQRTAAKMATVMISEKNVKFLDDNTEAQLQEHRV